MYRSVKKLHTDLLFKDLSRWPSHKGKAGQYCRVSTENNCIAQGRLGPDFRNS